MTQIRAELFKLCLKKVSKECSNLVSPKSPSVLRKVSAMDMKNFTLKKVSMELKERCPLFYSVLMNCAIPPSGKNGEPMSEWLPSVGVAASVLIKQRCCMMTGVQLMLMTLIKYTGFQVSLI